MIKCLLQTREGKGLIMLLPSPLAGRAVIEAADGTQRAFDLIDSEGEEATYQEVEEQKVEGEQ